MKVTIEKSFHVDKSPDVVWGFLINPNKIVECVPGVTLKEKVNETTYKGSVSQKFGPVSANYDGEVTYEKIDKDSWEITLAGKGVDSKGKGSAEMTLEMVLKPDDSGTVVNVVMIVGVIGMLAQFGSRLISDVSDHLFEKFVENFKTNISGGEIDEKQKEIEGGEIAATVFKSLASTIKGMFKSLASAIKGLFKKDKSDPDGT